MTPKTIFKDYKEILKTLLLPNNMYDSVLEIPFDEFYNNGYRYMLFDVDNTLLSRDNKLLSLEYQSWIERIKDYGFTVFLISNNSSYKRIKRVADQLRVRGLYFTFKPFSYSTRDLMKEHYIDPAKAIVIGDQILTDVMLGNWLKMHTILVDPIDKKLSFIKTLQREIELMIFDKVS